MSARLLVASDDLRPRTLFVGWDPLSSRPAADVNDALALVGCLPWCAIVTVMLGEQGRLGSAQVRWNDYVGTAAADDADALLNTRSLYKIAGLDRDRWTIVGIDFMMGAASERVVVYGIDRTAAEPSPEDLDRVAVTAVPSRRVSAAGRVPGRGWSNAVSVRLLSSAVSGKDLVVADHAQLAEAHE